MKNLDLKELTDVVSNHTMDKSLEERKYLLQHKLLNVLAIPLELIDMMSILYDIKAKNANETDK